VGDSHYAREVCGLGSSTQVGLHCRKLVPHVSLHHPPASVSTPPLPSLPPLPSPGHPPSTAHPSPATTRSPYTAYTTNNTHITKMHPAPWRRDNSNPSSCNPLNHHPLPYPYNHLKRAALITCHRRAISSRSLSSAFLFTHQFLGLFSVCHRMLEYHPFLAHRIMGPSGNCFVVKVISPSLLSYFPFPVVDFLDLTSTHGCSPTHTVRFFGCSPSLSFLACSSTPTLPLSSGN